MGGKGQTHTVRELSDRYMDEHSKPNKGSWKRDKYSLDHILPILGDYTLDKITPGVISDYKFQRRQEGASGRTINIELALLSHMFTKGQEWEWCQDNPVSRISREKGNGRKGWALTYEEANRLGKTSPSWLKDIEDFALETGARRGEILSLTWDKVDLLR